MSTDWAELNELINKLMDQGDSDDQIIRLLTTPLGPERFDAMAKWVRQIRSVRPGRADWLAIVRAYRACPTPRPTQMMVAEQLGFGSEDPLRDRLRAQGIDSWHNVHARVAAEPLDLGS